MSLILVLMVTMMWTSKYVKKRWETTHYQVAVHFRVLFWAIHGYLLPCTTWGAWLETLQCSLLGLVGSIYSFSWNKLLGWANISLEVNLSLLKFFPVHIHLHDGNVPSALVVIYKYTNWVLSNNMCVMNPIPSGETYCCTLPFLIFFLIRSTSRISFKRVSAPIENNVCPSIRWNALTYWNTYRYEVLWHSINNFIYLAKYYSTRKIFFSTLNFDSCLMRFSRKECSFLNCLLIQF